MKKKTKIFLLILVIIVIIASIRIIVLLKNRPNTEQQWNNEFSRIDKNEINYQNDITVDELKEKMNFDADSSLYEVTTEYDGRKTLSIKRNILYKVAFAGIIKNDKLTIEEADEIFNKNYPNKNGIWISKQSRERFLQIIAENTNFNYQVNEDGYLTVEKNTQQNENDKKLNELINLNKKLIIDINSFDYEIDTITGEIVEYPFEQLDEEQTMDILINENDKIIVITTNKNGKVTNKEIFEDLINNM